MKNILKSKTFILLKEATMNPEQIHLHRRKRAHKQNLKKFPHSDPKISALDKVVTVLSYVYPLAGLPQIIQIYSTKTAQGVSLFTWVLFFLVTQVLLVYSVVHKDKRLATMWSLWSIVYLVVVVGIVLYG